jgi:hypothetical protein
MIGRMDDRGQAHTMEGVVAGLILVLTPMYITSSITFVSPQTDKSQVTKPEIISTDIPNVLSVNNFTGDQQDRLTTDIAQWGGLSADYSGHVNPAEPSIADLNRSIWEMLYKSAGHANLFFNINLTYETTPGTIVTMPIICNGYIFNDATAASGKTNSMIKPDVASSSKIIVLDSSTPKSSYWDGLAGGNVHYWPKVVEVKMEIWSL